jgi:Zn-finger nucleic acid-binding protein
MICPNCNTKLKKVIMKSHYGAIVELNQCPECGGVWCDKTEMHRVSSKSVRLIEKLDAKKLKKFTLIKKKLVCPKCKNLLKEFNDPYFPKQIKLEYCTKCKGFWLNRGELTQFKDWQADRGKVSKKELSIKDNELDKQMKQILALNEDSTLETWGQVGKFLSQPVHRFRGFSSEIKDVNSDAKKIIVSVYILFQIIVQIAKVAARAKIAV